MPPKKITPNSPIRTRMGSVSKAKYSKQSTRNVNGQSSLNEASPQLSSTSSRGSALKPLSSGRRGRPPSRSFSNNRRSGSPSKTSSRLSRRESYPQFVSTRNRSESTLQSPNSQRTKTPSDDQDSASEASLILFPCKNCGRRFGSRQRLNIHRSVHFQEHYYSCLTCFKTFPSLPALQLHQTIHKTLRCATCGLSFQDFRSLRFHHLNHPLESLEEANNNQHPSGTSGPLGFIS
ncbi:zinc finger and BTB domain-containing protein 24-like [Palaemon carinicauda]|uniref:zinc finger and BTB domain-containing protein 24-like n=1 Tax=Palaemon carinicauda TaxID=392227 RepID=UPI0035B5EC85